MNHDAPAPEAADWMIGWFRGLSLFRWPLCVVGTFLTGLSFGLAQACFEPSPPQLLAWWQQPIENATALASDLAGSLARTIFGGGLLLVVNGTLWTWIGSLIARRELAWRQVTYYRADGTSVQPAPNAFVLGARSFHLCVQFPLFALLCLSPLLLAAWINTWFGGLGSVVVALFLPLVLLWALILLYLASAAVGWPLMPMVLAEGGDNLGAVVAHAGTYAFQRFVPFTLLTAIALGLAYVPCGMVSQFAGDITNWAPETRQAFYMIGGGLWISIFWTLETLVYLHLSKGTAALSGEEGPMDAAQGADGTSPRRRFGPRLLASRAAPVTRAKAIRGVLLDVLFLAAAWFLTSYLLMRVGGGPTDWLDWGLASWSVSPAKDLGSPYKAASILGMIYAAAGMVYLAWRLRRALSGTTAAAAAGPEVEELFRKLAAGDMTDPQTCPRLVECLEHPNGWVRFQAYRHLVRLAPAGKSFGYKAWAGASTRNKAIAKWRQLILPPVATGAHPEEGPIADDCEERGSE
jgi:hypothetical protein